MGVRAARRQARACAQLAAEPRRNARIRICAVLQPTHGADLLTQLRAHQELAVSANMSAFFGISIEQHMAVDGPPCAHWTDSSGCSTVPVPTQPTSSTLTLAKGTRRTPSASCESHDIRHPSTRCLWVVLTTQGRRAFLTPSASSFQSFTTCRWCRCLLPPQPPAIVKEVGALTKDQQGSAAPGQECRLKASRAQPVCRRCLSAIHSIIERLAGSTKQK